MPSKSANVSRSQKHLDLPDQVNNSPPREDKPEEEPKATEPAPPTIRPLTIQPQERQIKYLGLVIEKDEEYIL